MPRHGAPPRHKPRRNPLDAAGITSVDYKDTDLLRRFISDRGKIRSRRVTGLTVRQQRDVARAVKNAREMALLPYAAKPADAARAKR
ncbi:30S ribosomal protein S18 [Yinghuangia sp. ASG 101]|uniref:30S ribosomal protein S18 n=1 Tax=Yinghuangia sp. ASG 101 TaxID=2896848 RepID=UPI001E475ED8|nr:30S ribosomal protein S18 [Yinghuangia sp. ASG 101]UGQ11533.1 30S ribosomal protein S18 [Yinghuangia sp. ASG 101]